MSDPTTTSAIGATATSPLQSNNIPFNDPTLNKKDLHPDATLTSNTFHDHHTHSAALHDSPGAYEQAPGGPHIHEAVPESEGEKEFHDDASKEGYPLFSGDKPWGERSWWYEIIPFRGMYYDFRRRVPFFVSDWTTAFQPKNWWTISQYVIRMYFINLMPAISYILDMNHRTHGAYGINEVILASALAAIVFPIFSIQPLTFVGVTGLINLVNYTQYDIVVGYYGLSQMDYLRVQAWSLIWAAGFHFIVSIFNLCDFTRFITDMTSQTFGFYVGIVYIQKGIELLILEYEPAPLDNATGWLSVTIAILFTVSVYLVTKIGQTSFLPFRMRYFVSSFAFVAGVIFWTGFSNFPNYSLRLVPIERLPITRSFFPTMDRSWFIDFWNIELRWIFVGAPLGFLIMLLFYFDHNVSSVMAQSRAFPVKRPAGFHWDFFLLGITTFVSGILGLPAPNGLVPQCPWSTDSLSVYKQMDKPKNDEEDRPLIGEKGKIYTRQHIVNTRVVENRLGHLAVGLLTIGTMTRPLLVVLGTMPRALFAGIFILVGWSSIEGNGITTRTLAAFKDRRLSKHDDPLLKVKRSKLALYVGIQWIFFALTFAISQTIAAIGFPVIIVLLIPFRYWIVPLWFSPRELRILDAPTADADVVLASIGHETEAVTGQGMRVARDTKIAGTEWDGDEDDEDRFDGNGQGYRGNADEKRPPTSSTVDFSKRYSNVKGYTIGDDEVEDSDDQFVTLTNANGESGGSSSQGLRTVMGGGDGAKTPEVDPEGHYRAWLKGPLSSNVDTEDSEMESNKAGTTKPAPLKEAKRSKSVTQSWWGKGGEVEAVERAPTPHTPATPVDTDQSRAVTPVGKKEKSDTLEVPTSSTAAGFGLKKWLSSKKNKDKVGNVLVPEPQTTNATVHQAGDRSPFATSPVSVSERTNQIPSSTNDLVESISTEGPSTKQTDIPQEPATRHQANESISSTHTNNLFLGGGLSPSEAGAAAANAVRDIQSSTDDTPLYHSMIPNISDTPGPAVHSSVQGPRADQEGHGHAVMAAVKDIVPDAKANATAVVEAVKEHIPGLGSESKSDDPEKSTDTSAAKTEKPAGEKASDDAVKNDSSKNVPAEKSGVAALKSSQVDEREEKRLEKEKKELEKAKLKEQKVEAKRAAKEEKQKEKAQARQKKEDAKRMKEEEELQAILAKQANARAESEKKRRELDEKIKALEKTQAPSGEKSKSGTAAIVPAVAAPIVAQKATETKPSAVKGPSTAPVPAPKIISKSELTNLSDQVAGHQSAVYKTRSGDKVVKPCLPEEAEFYQSALIKNPSKMSTSQSALVSRLSKYMPTYHGTVDIVDDSNVAATRAVILENLTHGFKHANVLDIKLGKQLWDSSASDEKRSRMEEASRSTTSGTTGIRLTGWQIWDSSKSQYIKVGKTFGKSIKPDQLNVGLRSFFGLGSAEDAEFVSKLSNTSTESVSLPVKSVERILTDGVLPALKEIHEIVKKLEWRAHGSSLLIAYEGDPDLLEKGTKRSFTRSGRTQKQKDNVIDVSTLSIDTQAHTVERLVDVRLIDFAHTAFTPNKGSDQGYVSGIDTTRTLLERLAKDARKGKVGGAKKSGIAALAAAPVASALSKEESKPKDAQTEDKKVSARSNDVVVTSKADPKQSLVSEKKDTAASPENMKAEESAPIAAAPIITAAALPLARKDEKEASEDRNGREKVKSEPVTQSKQKPQEVEKDNKPGRFTSIFSRKDKSEKAVQKEDDKKVDKADSKPIVAAVLPAGISGKGKDHDKPAGAESTNVSKDAPVLPQIESSDFSNKETSITQAEPAKDDAKKDDAFEHGLVGAVGAGATIGAGSVLLEAISNKDHEADTPNDAKAKEKAESITNAKAVESTQTTDAPTKKSNKAEETPVSAGVISEPKHESIADDFKAALAPITGGEEKPKEPVEDSAPLKESKESDLNEKEKLLVAAAGVSSVLALTATTEKKEEEAKNETTGEEDRKGAKKEAKESRKEGSDATSEKRKSRITSLFTSTGNKRTPQASSTKTDQDVKSTTTPTDSKHESGPSFSGAPSGGLVDTRAPQEIEDARQKEGKKDSAESTKQTGLAALLGPLSGSNKKNEKDDVSQEKGPSFSAAPAGSETAPTTSSDGSKKDAKPVKKSSKIGLFALKKKSADEKADETPEHTVQESKPEAAKVAKEDLPPALPVKEDSTEPAKKEERIEESVLPGAAGAAILAAPAIAISTMDKEEQTKVKDDISAEPGQAKIANKETLEKGTAAKEAKEGEEESGGLFGLIRRKTKKGKEPSVSAANKRKSEDRPAEIASAAVVAKSSEKEKALKEEIAKAEAAAKKANAEAEKARLEAKKVHEEAERVHKEAEEVKRERQKIHEEAEIIKKERQKAHEEAERMKEERQKAEEALKKAEKLKAKEKPALVPIPIPVGEHDKNTSTEPESNETEQAAGDARTSSDLKSTKSTKRKSGFGLFGFGGKKSEEDKSLPVPPDAEKLQKEAEQVHKEAEEVKVERQKMQEEAEDVKKERQKAHAEAALAMEESKKAHEEAELVKKERQKAHEEAESVKKERKKAQEEAEQSKKERKKAEEEAEKSKKERQKTEEILKKERKKAEEEAEKSKKERQKNEEILKKERKKAEEEAEKSKKERQKAEEALQKAEKIQAKEQKSDHSTPLPIPIPLVGHDMKSSDKPESKEVEGAARTSTDLKSTKSTKRKSGFGLFGFGGKKSEEDKSLPVLPQITKVEEVEEQPKPKASTPPKKDDADGSALDAQIPPEILNAIERGDGKDVPPPPLPTKKAEKKSVEIVPVPIEKGKKTSNGGSGSGNGSTPSSAIAVAAASDQQTSRDEGQQSKLTSFFSRGGGMSGLGRSLTQKKNVSSEPHPAAVVEEVIEETEHGTQKFIRVTNPPRGAGKSVSAVQWRDPS